jgi:hypothetical protein
MRTIKLLYVVVFATASLSICAEAQWIQSDGPYGGQILSLAFSGTNIFAGTAFGGVYLSTNSGQSWAPVNNGLSNTYVEALATSGKYIFAGTNNGVYVSTNNGASWVWSNNGLANEYVRSFVINGTKVFVGTLGGVYMSQNNGGSWTAVNNGLASNAVYALAASDTHLYAGTNGGVYRSTYSGK